MPRFYLTTTLPYVNAEPHIGFAAEIVHADILARFFRGQGQEVFFNTGVDEHGQKIYLKAKEKGIDPKAYVDEWAPKFSRLKEGLNLSFDNFIRTTDEHHEKAAQRFWEECQKNGYIYKKFYQIKYCVGCELEKTESELNEEGRCPIHPDLELELISEENYFFKFSAFQEGLLELYEKNSDFVIPEHRFREIKSFVERGLEDFSISRLASKMSWGIPVPGDEAQVMYVWFDALVNYISAIGWPDKKEEFEKWWPVVQLAGKDNLRQQSAMWQAMLLAAGLPPSQQIIIRGFITSGGQKMSKSLGNVVSPYDLVNEYGTDAVRYYLAREISSFEDSDYTAEKFKEAYNGNLANGLGNLVSRVMKMAETHLAEPVSFEVGNYPENYLEHLSHYRINQAADVIWEEIGRLDRYVQETEPFKTIKTDKDKALEDIRYLVKSLAAVGQWLVPFMPETAEKILEAVKTNSQPSPLFVRK